LWRIRVEVNFNSQRGEKTKKKGEGGDDIDARGLIKDQAAHPKGNGKSELAVLNPRFSLALKKPKGPGQREGEKEGLEGCV